MKYEDTNLTKEYGYFVDYFATSLAEFMIYNQNAIHASFASDDEKRSLLEKLNKFYTPLV